MWRVELFAVGVKVREQTLLQVRMRPYGDDC